MSSCDLICVTICSIHVITIIPIVYRSKDKFRINFSEIHFKHFCTKISINWHHFRWNLFMIRATFLLPKKTFFKCSYATSSRTIFFSLHLSSINLWLISLESKLKIIFRINLHFEEFHKILLRNFGYSWLGIFCMMNH